MTSAPESPIESGLHGIRADGEDLGWFTVPGGSVRDSLPVRRKTRRQQVAAAECQPAEGWKVILDVPR